MKKVLCLILAAVMMISAVPIVFADSPVAAWNSTKKCFEITAKPVIEYITADSDGGRGTKVSAAVTNPDAFLDFKQNIDAYGSDELVTLCYGKQAEYSNITVYIQYAYSFDNTHWVNDESFDLGDNYFPVSDFSNNKYVWTDPDNSDYKISFEEYVDLPTYLVDSYRSINNDIFNGTDWSFTWGGVDVPGELLDNGILSKENALKARVAAMFPGADGQYTATFDEDDYEHGYQINFTDSTLYLKARYRVYTSYTANETDYNKIAFSPWSDVKQYDNSKASAEAQGCSLVKSKLKTTSAGTLTCVRAKKESDSYEYCLRFEVTDTQKAELKKYYALVLNSEKRNEITGELFNPDVVIEAKGKDGKWYYFDDYDYNNVTYRFNTGTWPKANYLEAIGMPDPLYLRARIAGSSSWDKTDSKYYSASEITYYKTTFDSDAVIMSGASKELSLSLSGNYRIYYNLLGGNFKYGTEQKEKFTDESTFVVDLTADAYKPVRQNYTFDGWYEDEACKSSKITSINTATSKKSFQLYAKWNELPFYTITFNLNGYTGAVYNYSETKKIHSDEGDDANGILVLDNPDAAAEFLGWYDQAEGGNKVTQLQYSKLSGNKTLYAHWNLQTVHITYVDAYTNSPKNINSYVVSPDGNNDHEIFAPTRTGYEFDGWYLVKNGNKYDSGLYFNEAKKTYILNESQDVTLYAKWIKGRWNITYKFTVDGVYNPNPEKYTYGEPVTFKDASVNGYIFKGWYKESSYKTAIKSISATDSGAKTVYGKFEAIPYKISYDCREVDLTKFFVNPNPTTRTINQEVVLKPLTPASKDYKFLGWYNNINFDGQPYTKIAAGTDKSIALYAKVYKYQWGDVDFDGNVTINDARLVLRHAIQLEKLADDACAWGDVNKPDSAHKLDVSDARTVLRIAIKLDSVAGLKLPERPQ